MKLRFSLIFIKMKRTVQQKKFLEMIFVHAEAVKNISFAAAKAVLKKVFSLLENINCPIFSKKIFTI